MEILVHLAAPSTARDDARYRALVAGILELEPLPWLAADTGLEPTQLSDAPSPGSPGNPVCSSEEPRRDLPITSALVAPGQSPIETAIGTRVAPRDSLYQLESFKSLISVVPDSLDHQSFDQHPDASISDLLPNAPPRLLQSVSPQDADAPASKRPRIEPSRTVNDPPEVQNSPPDTARCSKNRPVSCQDIIGSAGSTKNQQTSCITDYARSTQHETRRPLPLSAISIFPQSASLPLEIRPPPPPISTAPFTTHITPTLSMLTERLKPSRTYKPLHQARELDALERGHWSLQFNILRDTDSPLRPGPHVANAGHVSEPARPIVKNARHWTAASFQRFWSFLSDFVGKDARAGWGVWCVLEGAHAAPDSPSPSPADAFPVLLKVYAWGETVMHVYLLLFLASERRIREMGAQWRDSREELVIQMP